MKSNSKRPNLNRLFFPPLPEGTGERLKIIITYPTRIPGELEQIIHLLENEDCCLHLRKPDYSEAEYEALLQAIPVIYHGRIVLHDYYSLQDKYAVGGIHLSTKKRSVIDKSTLAHWRSGTCTLSTSIHSLEELKSLDGQFDYAFLSPIFPSISKQGYEGNLDISEVEAYLHTAHKTKVIALGGIDASKIKQIEAWGFDGYAMLGSVWKLK